MITTIAAIDASAVIDTSRRSPRRSAKWRPRGQRADRGNGWRAHVDSLTTARQGGAACSQVDNSRLSRFRNAPHRAPATCSRSHTSSTRRNVANQTPHPHARGNCRGGCRCAGHWHQRASARRSLPAPVRTLVAPFVVDVFGPDFQTSTGNSVVTTDRSARARASPRSASKTVDFGASDAPLTSAQEAACTGCVEIPWALAGTGLSYNLAGVPHLNLSGAVIAGIYLGHDHELERPSDRRAEQG